MAKLTGSTGEVKIWHHLAPVHRDAKTSGGEIFALHADKKRTDEEEGGWKPVVHLSFHRYMVN